MFNWLKRKISGKNKRDIASPQQDHAIRGEIAVLIRATVMDQATLRQTTKPNCAIVLNAKHGACLRWLSETDNYEDVVGFVFFSQLETYKELLQACMDEIKNGTFDDTFLYGPGSLLFERVAFEAFEKIKAT